MNNLALFNKTKQKLAFSYAGVMGLILSVLGFGAYEFTVYDRQLAIDREIESVAGTIHDSLESKLVRPNRISPAARQVIPNLCLVNIPCEDGFSDSSRHVAGVLGQGRYYLILLNLQGQVKATSGVIPKEITQPPFVPKWMNLTDAKGQHYRQFSTEIHTVNHLDWGELRIGRNNSDLNKSIASLQFTLLISIPIAIILVGAASWYLAGKAMQPISDAYDRLQLFTANVAHELRTPLATTQLTLDEYISEYQAIDPQVVDILSTIHSQNLRLIRLVTDLLFLAQLERGSIVNDNSICNLDEIVEDLGEEFDLLTQDRQIIVSIPPDIKPVRIRGNPDRIARLVSNLLENATKYTPAGGEIAAKIERTSTQIRLIIADTGMGIAPSEQSKIFDRFYRINSDRARQTGGTGLGLAIVKSIANLYGAKLQVKSQLGIGSTFIVDFPLLIDFLEH